MSYVLQVAVLYDGQHRILRIRWFAVSAMTTLPPLSTATAAGILKSAEVCRPSIAPKPFGSIGNSLDRAGVTPQRKLIAIFIGVFIDSRFGLEIPGCPFGNLPEATSGRWGQGLTKAKMADCRWLRPVLVGSFEFLEWTGENHLRHTRFMGLRDGVKARDVTRET
jgi:hypothetical protein